MVENSRAGGLGPNETGISGQHHHNANLQYNPDDNISMASKSISF